MLRQFRKIIILSLLLSNMVFAAESPSWGVYLSFKQRMAMTYALLAQGQSEAQKLAVAERAKAFFAGSIAKPVETIQVRNFAEFLAHYRGEWPGTNSVALDIEIIEKAGPPAVAIYKSASPRIQNQIDSYLDWQGKQLLEIARAGQASVNSSETSLIPEVLTREVVTIAQNPPANKFSEIAVLNQIDALFTEQMKELDRVGEKIAQSGFAQQQESSVRIFMQTLFSEYFSRLDLSTKKLMVSSFLGGDLRADEMKKFEIMIQNSGPQLQKLLQVIARQAGIPTAVLDVFKKLENSVRPVPWVQIEEMLKAESNNFKITYFERRPLGVGTMAQVHRAKIEYQGVRQDVVIRFIKPGIADRVEEDKRILTAVAGILDNNAEFKKTGAPKLAPIIDDITATVTAELSQEDTIARQRQAKRRYEKTVLMRTPEYSNYIEFRVPTVYEPKGPKSQFMVQEMVIGQKLDKEVALYEDLAPNLKKGVVEAMARLWATEIFFGEGFYHSDLHQGNFMMRLTDPKILLHILDFGMGGTISPDLQGKVMLLGVGVELSSPDLIARAFWGLSNKAGNTINEGQFTALVAAKVQEIKLNPESGMGLNRWTAWAMDQGLKLPYDFVSLNRGMAIVNKLLKDSGSDLDVTKIDRKSVV